ncbi:AsmA family protein [Antarcticimicrobium sediminis]|uniref:AsmA family protein n=1 Tax=Antarcticimicrobium sediminis TaxID=2546227 RepID=A0A4R5EPV7_9RHOB|nr:AsmA family protein [Antarcticimicrobium sediminis]TDE36694.1 AsmA family protein [Antarcticimicrobium sediminis]
MKWIFRIIAIVLVAVALAVVGILFLPSERIAQIAADQIEAQTGRAVRIEGGVQVSVWPVLGAETGPVTLANADWAGAEPMLQADGLAIGVDAAALIGGTVRVTRIVAERPVLNLTTRADGTGNWVFGTDASATTSETGSTTVPPITLDRLELTGARLFYSDAGAAPVALGPLDLVLDWPHGQEAADVTARLSHNGAAIDLTARITAMEGLLAGKVVPLSASASLGKARLEFDGRASLAGAAAGRVTAKSPDTAALMSALGLGAVDLPKGAGRSAELTTNATYTADGRLSLRDLALVLDQNKITGAADVTLAGTPRVVAELSAGALDLSALGGGESTGSGSSGGGSEDGWSKTPIDASALGLVDGVIKLHAQSIDTGTVKLGPTEAALTLERSRAVLKLNPAAVFGGSLSGELVANARKGFSVRGDLSAKDMDMTALLRDLVGIDRFSGKGEARVAFLGSGASVDAIMRSLSGEGSLSVGRGVISGIDLDKLFRSGAVTGGTTVFDSLKASYRIEGGNLQNDDLLLLLSSFKVAGAGRVGLGARDLDYLVTPTAFESEGSTGLQVPVRFTGPWSNPRIRPDLDAATKVRLEEQKDKLEQKAKEKLQEKLNLTIEDGQSTEEAIKDRLEDEAAKQLKKLFGSD